MLILEPEPHNNPRRSIYMEHLADSARKDYFNLVDSLCTVRFLHHLQYFLRDTLSVVLILLFSEI